MYTFKIQNSKGKITEFNGINKVVIPELGDDEVITGDAILTYQYPVDSGFYLYSDKASHTVSSAETNIITVEKEI